MDPNVDPMADNKYLERHHLTWVMRVKVPTDLRKEEGQTRITISLQTHSLAEARARRDIELGRLRAHWTRMRAKRDESPATLTWLMDRLADVRMDAQRHALDEETASFNAMELLETFLKEQPQGPDGPEVTPEATEAIRGALQAVADPGFISMAEAVKTYLDEIEERVRPQTHHERTQWLRRLAAWTGKERGIGTITRRDAGRYVTEVILPMEITATSKRNQVSGLSSFFNWCEQRGLCEANPFHRVSAGIRDSKRGERRKYRPWRQDELLKFLTETPRGDLRWSLCALAAYTGMRREELCRVTAGEIKGDGAAIEITEGKTDSSVRVVPIHPVIRPLVLRLAADTPDGYLLPGQPRLGPNGQRGKYLGKQFAAQLRTLGLTEVRLHDLRRTMSQALRDAGVPVETAEYIIGHRVQSMTYGYYSPGPSFDRLKEAVENITYGDVDTYVTSTLARRSTHKA